ncbi:pentatricopeptide repeat-containing protein [Tanacetum coccineum]
MSAVQHVPDQEHYACLIDLLGRAGHFDEVVNQLRKIPIKPDARVWKALLGICRIHGNLKLGTVVVERLIELEPQSSVGYVFLIGIYAGSGKWESVAKVRKIMNERDVRKDYFQALAENAEAPRANKFVITNEYFQQVTQALMMRLRQHEEIVAREGTGIARMSQTDLI